MEHDHREQLLALLIGLEMQEIDSLLKEPPIIFKFLGQMMIDEIYKIKNNQPNVLSKRLT